MAVPKKVIDRMTAGLKQLVPILEQQRARDVSEADTVTLVKDLLKEVFGYDKYTELTGELCIRGTYCDLAVRLDDKVCEIIEVKAIGVTLNERHLRQAVDYAANKGVEWVILTNAVNWQLYHIIFAKPIDYRSVAEMDITNVDCRNEEDIELAYAFTKEGFKKGVPGSMRDRQDATSRFLLAALLLHNENVRSIVRRELRRVVDVNVTEEEIVKVLESEVIKRDAVEGPPAEEATARVKKSGDRSLRTEQNKPAAAVAASEETPGPLQSLPTAQDPSTDQSQPPTGLPE